MRLGYALPQVGSLASGEALVEAAQHAEAQGFDSVWVLDRLLWPLAPKAGYPATPDGSLPEAFKTVLDPLESLTFVAAHTQRVALGTSVLNIPFYNPLLLARQLTTLDVLSKGRLRLGMGMGWSPDEFEAVGAPAKRGPAADEFLQALKAIWTQDPAEFKGEYYTIAKSVVYPKPVQQPHPPIYLAAYSPPAMRRVAQYADGWNPGGIPAPGMQEMLGGIRQMAQEAGRDPSAIALIVRANVYFVDGATDDQRGPFMGSADQIASDVAACRAIDAAEIQFDVQFSPGVGSLEEFKARMEQLREIAQE